MQGYFTFHNNALLLNLMPLPNIDIAPNKNPFINALLFGKMGTPWRLRPEDQQILTELRKIMKMAKPATRQLNKPPTFFKKNLPASLEMWPNPQALNSPKPLLFS